MSAAPRGCGCGAAGCGAGRDALLEKMRGAGAKRSGELRGARSRCPLGIRPGGRDGWADGRAGRGAPWAQPATPRGLALRGARRGTQSRPPGCGLRSPPFHFPRPGKLLSPSGASTFHCFLKNYRSHPAHSVQGRLFSVKSSVTDTPKVQAEGRSAEPRGPAGLRGRKPRPPALSRAPQAPPPASSKP